jgi:hypothetical protein
MLPPPVFVGTPLRPNDVILRVNGADARDFKNIFAQGDISMTPGALRSCFTAHHLTASTKARLSTCTCCLLAGCLRQSCTSMRPPPRPAPSLASPPPPFSSRTQVPPPSHHSSNQPVPPAHRAPPPLLSPLSGDSGDVPSLVRCVRGSIPLLLTAPHGGSDQGAADSIAANRVPLTLFLSSLRPHSPTSHLSTQENSANCR